MPSTRRNFIHKITKTAGLLATAPFFNSIQGQDFLTTIEQYADIPIDLTTTDENFWHIIKQAYTVSPTMINLNNGGVSPQPKVVQEAVERYNRLSNETPSYYMWRVLDRGREALREKLANLAGVSPDEIAINRNSSEALETIIFGLRLKAGDEVVLSRYDYPNMINAWKQRAHRDGVVLKWVDFEHPLEDENLIVQLFEQQFTDKTKLVHVTHMINWTGQVLPVKAIAKAAKSRGIEVLVDAAHSFAHLDYKISDLDCDYFGTSLHKWLCAPFGSGLLYVKKDKIKNLYPLFAAPNPEDEDIRKFEHLGTRSFAIEQAIGQAVDFHQMIGTERKAKRLKYLKDYWAKQIIENPKVKLYTSLKNDWSGALALVDIEGVPAGELSQILFKEHFIHTTTINWHNVKGVRITPNVYTLTSELDKLVRALKKIMADG